MTTENPRIHVMLDPETKGLLASLAARNDRSLSMTAADLIREALELHEDAILSAKGDERLSTHSKKIAHQEAWK